MSDGGNNPHWYRVAGLRPRLHGQVRIGRHDYRGLIWYLLEDPASGRSHRFNPAAYQFIGLMDGQRSVAEIRDMLDEKLGEYAPGQDELIDLLGRLYQADLLHSDAPPDTEEMLERQSRRERDGLRQRAANPVALRFPLWDPEDFLNRHFGKVAWLFTPWAALGWLIVVCFAAVLAARHWAEIARHFEVIALSPYNLLLMVLLYPPIKFLHELGHGFSAKLEGGEVHEMGINFLLFMPVPYVNVSTAAHFRSRGRRMLVSAAGILVESFLAALGLFLFFGAEPGLVRDIGFNVFVIGGVSSLFFNGNPLLKYDGYYLLADALDLPNLYQRAPRYWIYLLQRYGFGVRDAVSPCHTPAEARWFLVYSVLALAYRLAILWFILAVVAEYFFFAGVLLALWLGGVQFGRPLWRGLRYLLASPALGRRRARAVMASAGLLATLVLLLGFLPMPSYTLSQGVVWRPDEVRLRAQHEGFVDSLFVADRQPVKAGDPILALHDPFLSNELRIARARVRELEARHRAARASSNVEAGISGEALRVARLELEHKERLLEDASIDAFRDGRLLLIDAADLPGRFVRRGDLLGFIEGDETPVIRAAVTQDHIGQLREGYVDIRVRLASRPGREYPARLLRQTPEATHRLPSPALATSGGGPIVAMPGADGQPEALEKIFIVDLEPDFGGDVPAAGVRAWVRVEHGSEAIARQFYRRLRQVFLRQFNA